MSKVRTYDEPTNLYKQQIVSNSIRGLHSSLNARRIVNVSGQLSDLMVGRPKTNNQLERTKVILHAFRSESLVSLEDKARSSMVNYGDDMSGKHAIAASVPQSLLRTNVTSRKSTAPGGAAFTNTNYSSFDPQKRSTAS